MKMLINYLTNEEVSNIILNPQIITQFITLICKICQPYTEIDIEKFKYTDLLKNDKELEKKKQASPKTIKSEIIEKILIFIKNLFNKARPLSLPSDENKIEILNHFLILFSKEYLDILTHENEKNRQIYAELVDKYLVKLFLMNNDLKTDYSNPDPKLLHLYNNMEDYIVNEVYDANLDVRKACITIFNTLMHRFPKGTHFNDMCRLFEVVDGNINFLQAMQYLDEDNKKIDVYFKDFKNLFSTIINLYIDEKFTFGTLCDKAMGLVIQKFPIYCLNELMKAQKKGQLNRIEVIDKMFKKHLKEKN
jgi:hypothetical protein